MSRLITATLIDAIDWFNVSPATWKQRAYVQLLNQLNRKWIPPEKAVQRGIDFEKTIYECLKAGEHTQSSFTKQAVKDYNIADLTWFISRCKNCEIQKKIKRFIRINNIEYCLFGKIDVWSNDLITDIKTTGNYKGEDYYIHSFQNKLYSYITGNMYFRYLIAVFNDTGEIIDKIELRFKQEQTTIIGLRNYIDKKIIETMDFLEADLTLITAYKEKFCLY